MVVKFLVYIKQRFTLEALFFHVKQGAAKCNITNDSITLLPCYHVTMQQLGIYHRDCI